MKSSSPQATSPDRNLGARSTEVLLDRHKALSQAVLQVGIHGGDATELEQEMHEVACELKKRGVDCWRC